MSHLLWRLFQVTLALCCCCPMYAQHKSLDSVQHVDEVVVTQQLTYREVIPSQTLKGDALHRLSSLSVADAIRYFSGVQLKDYGGVGGLKTVNVRSMGSHHVGVFYDGVEVGNAQNGVVDLGQFSLDNVEEISLYNGQKSAIFQPATEFGNAGSVYIRTRRPRFTGGKRTNILGSLKVGSFGVVSPYVRWEQKWSDRISSALSAEYLNANGRYKFRYRKVLKNGETAWDTTAVRENGDVKSLR